MLNKKYLVDITRETLNHMEGKYLCSDFTGWCEGASSINFYILMNYMEERDVHIMSGTFNGHGHMWVVVNDEIIDATVDQFGDEYSVYSAKMYEDLYQERYKSYTPLVFDDWMEYIDQLLDNEERRNYLTLEEDD